MGEFRIRALLGEGAMGEVYLAQDMTLGRRVALKLIKRSVMHADALERFLEEARATASFSHPHIVTLHAVGEHEGRPFLALEYLDGESLRARLAEGAVPVREALRHGHAIAEAIAEAHRHGIVHADLKPENIVIPRDGRVRVVDFGLAKLVGRAPSSASGTPAYMAPERWRGAAPTGAIDVWAFGILLHELITGTRPISDAALATLAFSTSGLELPSLPQAPWASLVQDCLSLDPGARPTADELVRRLAALLDPRGASVEPESRCPFPGLAAFSREHAGNYFGREDELDALVEQLRTRPLIPIVGPSGIGKSSFVRAALLPRLEDSGRWAAVTLRPGSAPFESLAVALAVPGRAPEEVAESLRRHPETLSLLLGELGTRRDARVLLFLDQFEETFTLARSSDDAVAFCECLATAAATTESWRVVLTLRDDFLGRLAEAPTMRPLLGAVMRLAALSSADLRAAVLGPLGNAGYAPDSPDLVERIVDDVAGQPACLPLLQFTCYSLWERRDVATRRILTSEYDAMGGATGALAAHAQRFIAELTPEQVRLARNILLALVHPDGTRRPRLRTELLDDVAAGAGAVVDHLIDRLLGRRLIVATRDTDHEIARIEVAHEALATTWPQLARWLDETYEERLLVAEIEQASTLWSRRGRRDDETWGGGALADAVRKVEEWNISLPSVSREFLEACIRRDTRSRRRRRWLIGTAIGVLAAVASSVVFAAIAFARTERERRLAEENMGSFQLRLEPFDWDLAQHRPVAPRTLPTLDWKLYFVDSSEPGTPGAPYGPDDLRRGARTWSATDVSETVEARSGAAVLEISGRGGDCPPSVLHLQRLPGYRDQQLHGRSVVHVRVPTCQASRAGMLEIPDGIFFRNRDRDAPPGTQDEPATLPTFWIDRTEVTRAAFDLYDALEPLTGVGSARTGPTHEDERLLPAVGISHAAAMAYCRYMGKELPSVDQWQKAFRGGLRLGDAPNPAPRRHTTWLQTTSERPANLSVHERDDGPAPVGSFADDTSPYGVVDMAGNVSEWTRTRASVGELDGLRIVLGSNWNTRLDREHHRITWRNTRHDRYLDFVIGLRCVSSASAPPPR